jgi:hypothetical protein
MSNTISSAMAEQTATMGPQKEGFEGLSPKLQFTLLGCGVFLFFGAHNYLQEAMMNIPGFNFGVMLGYMEVFG